MSRNSELLHARFDRSQIFRRERPLIGKVVIKTILDHRSDGDLGLGEQLLDRLRQ
jgi:hypothetical protein